MSQVRSICKLRLLSNSLSAKEFRTTRQSRLPKLFHIPNEASSGMMACGKRIGRFSPRERARLPRAKCAQFYAMVLRAILANERSNTMASRWCLASGERVLFTSLPFSFIHRAGILARVFAQIRAESRELIVEEVQFAGEKGVTWVETSVNDKGKIYFAKRRGQELFSRFVAGRNQAESDYVSVMLRRDPPSDEYILVTAWFGRKNGKPEPMTEGLTSLERIHSIAFWGKDDQMPGRAYALTPAEHLKLELRTQCPW
jgi:hypothetical protein